MKSKLSTPTSNMILRILILACLLLPSSLLAAITEVGTPTLGSDTGGGTSISVARTTTSGSKGLTVQLSYYNGSGAVAAPTLSWNGTAMTTACESANALGGNDKRSAVYFIADPAAGTFNLTGTFSNTSAWRLAIREWSNANNYHDCSTANGDSGTPSVNVPNVVAGEVTLDALAGNTTLAVGSGQSATNSYNGNLAGSIDGGASIDTSSTGTVAMDWTSGSSTWAISAFALVEAPSFSLEQEGFRWGVDDGNESAHGWEAAQDTDITIADNQSRLLRVLVNATGDPSSLAYTLRAQKNGAGGYSAVAVGSSTKTTPVIESGDATESGNNTASTSWAVSYPNASTGDLLILCISWDDSTTTTDVSEPAGPNGESLSEINATPATDAGTAVRAKCWYTVATGTWTSSTLTFTPTASEQWTASVVRVPAGEFDSSTPIGATDTEGSASAGTNVNHGSFSAGASDGSGKLCVWTAVDTNAQTVASGFSQVSNTDRGAVSGGFFARNTVVSDSESFSATAVSTITSEDWATVAFVVRAPTITNEVYITPSANITAGGEATTARLTAPSGKSTSDFVTGRRWDDENGTDTIDITTDDYTEVEWLVNIAASASPSDFYDFRVYQGSSALSTYTVTPRWTIPSGASVYNSIMLMGVGK